VIGFVVHRKIDVEQIDELDVEVIARNGEVEEPIRNCDADAAWSCTADDDLENGF
jgi:hypothetical protein